MTDVPHMLYNKPKRAATLGAVGRRALTCRGGSVSRRSGASLFCGSGQGVNACPARFVICCSFCPLPRPPPHPGGASRGFREETGAAGGPVLARGGCLSGPDALPVAPLGSSCAFGDRADFLPSGAGHRPRRRGSDKHTGLGKKTPSVSTGLRGWAAT